VHFKIVSERCLNFHLFEKLQSESMNIPQLTIISNSNETSDELIVMEKLLQNAKEQFVL